MDENSENWQDYPYIVEWVEQMKKWAAVYQIYDFIPADNDGQDPSGRIPKENTGAHFLVLAAENEGTIEKRFIWTLEDTGGSDGRWITSEFGSGTWHGFRGWYLGRVPHTEYKQMLPGGKLACNKCYGQDTVEDSEGDDVDCDLCEGGQTSLYFSLEDTDFRLGT